MTTVERPAAGGSTLSRVPVVVTLQFTNPWSILVIRWLILFAILAMNIAIWLLLFASTPPENHPDIREGLMYGGAGTYIFVYMLVAAVQAINGYFPFALGYGVTRRTFYLGISLTFVLLLALFTVGQSVLGAIEQVTGGWGTGGSMFTASYFGTDWLQRAFVYFVALLFLLLRRLDGCGDLRSLEVDGRGRLRGRRGFLADRSRGAHHPD